MGNGGSVDEVAPGFWTVPGVAYIGTNRCLVMASVQHVPWTAVCMRDHYRSMWADPIRGWEYHERHWKPATCWKVGAAGDRGPWCNEYVRQIPLWRHKPAYDHNREMAVMRNSSVVLMAANWAWLCGARKIYLIGVDYHPPAHGRMIEPWASLPQGNAGHYDRPVPPAIEKQFRRAVRAVTSAGGKMVNLSPQTALQAVPQQAWSEALRP